ncbi:hypothetical protein [Lactococcus kimchii]|uniref:hypothetical protein n=1 Tax=Lactococcus sp. S-13 TaxID=2507158 RepID=UPI001023AD8F|nr:hypothetical protein [Lactococcus sp. S-13]RZI48296.1 hypothetical protein EQJ87_01890 [Lactococcus sp. S-13]
MKSIQTKLIVASAATLLLASTVAGATLQAYQAASSSPPQSTQKVSATSVIKNTHALVLNENGQPVAQTLDNSDLSTSTADEGKTYEDILNSEDTTATTQSVDGAEVTTVTNDEDNTVGAFSVTNTEDGSSVSIVNDGSTITIAKTTVDSTGQTQTEEQTLPVDNTTGSAQAMAWTSWGYTNIAVGSRVFAYAVDTAIIGLGTAAATACLPGAVAAAAGCSVAAAKGFVGFTAGVGFGYLATIKSPGQWLAGKLDTNHNGWIGIYYRHDPSTGAAQWKTI